jgi:hypothetical protein
VPKPTCQLNLTLDVPTAEWVERIARDVNLRPSGAGRVLLLQRMALEDKGWKIDDEDVGSILGRVAALEERDLEAVKELLDRVAPEPKGGIDSPGF